MRVMKLLLVAALVGLPLAFGMPVELIENGEFEPPPTGYWVGDQSAVAGWTTNYCAWGACWMEIFPEGFADSPAIGADGLPTGQHCEITVDNDWEVVSQVVTVPPECVFADFSFEMWPRGGSGVKYWLTGTGSGTILSDSVTGPGDAWTPHSATGLPIIPGEDITLSFQSIGGGGAGAHIDSVSLLAYTPEPSTLGLSILGLLALARRRRHKN